MPRLLLRLILAAAGLIRADCMRGGATSGRCPVSGLGPRVGHGFASRSVKSPGRRLNDGHHRRDSSAPRRLWHELVCSRRRSARRTGPDPRGRAEAVRAADRRERQLLRAAAGAVRDQRTFGQRQDDAAQPRDRHRPSQQRHGPVRRRARCRGQRERACTLARPACRDHLPVLPPDPDTDRVRERPARARARRRRRAAALGVARPGGQLPGVGRDGLLSAPAAERAVGRPAAARGRP